MQYALFDLCKPRLLVDIHEFLHWLHHVHLELILRGLVVSRRLVLILVLLLELGWQPGGLRSRRGYPDDCHVARGLVLATGCSGVAAALVCGRALFVIDCHRIDHATQVLVRGTVRRGAPSETDIGTRSVEGIRSSGPRVMVLVQRLVKFKPVEKLFHAADGRRFGICVLVLR